MPLKSTHKPVELAPLAPGWTEHKAPTGHMYYYNAQTKESTYTRPTVEPIAQPAQPALANPYANAPSLADPRAANQYMAQFNQPQSQQHGRGNQTTGRGGFEGRPKPQPIDKPRRKERIPGHEPWILVYTKYSRRFVYNSAKNTSYWRIPEKLMPAILELDKARIKRAAAGDDAPPEAEAGGDAGDSSEYEEVEVTDDEGDNDGQASTDHPHKRQRLEDDGQTGAAEDDDEEEQEGEEEEEDAGPIEFTEDDIAMQLQAMGEDYDLEPGEYDDGNMEDWPEGAQGVEFSQEDAKLLFKDLLNDFRISPYSPWDKLIEEGKVIDDQRYTALSTTKARKECWDEWTRERIAEIKEQRARQAKTDPRIPYLALLQEKATPKLFWPEFKRKYKKEDAMKDMKLTDKEREKLYREHINRLKLPPSTLRADLTTLLKSMSILQLHNQSKVDELPDQILTDLRFISLDPKVRDPLIEALVQTLPPPAEDIAAAEEDEDKRKQREAKAKRSKALEEHNRMIDEQKRRRERDIASSKARLRDEERELEMAMHVSKRGLQSQLASMKETTDNTEE